MTSQQWDPTAWTTRVDVTKAHPARRYDWLLGGKDNYEVDRESGRALEEAFPTIRTSVVENRRFLGRAVRWLVQEAGVRQFLDIGTGIPAASNTHEVAQAIAPEVRVVYVDNDPIVLAHARALLTSNRQEGRTAYIDADLRNPDAILTSPELLKTLDPTQPVAVLLISVMHFIRDAEDPYGLVAHLVDALPSVSYLAMSHATGDFLPKADVDAINDSDPNITLRLRSREEFAGFFDGRGLVSPGVVGISDWHPDAPDDQRPPEAEVACYGAVARIRR
jgi:hypothetical protein